MKVEIIKSSILYKVRIRNLLSRGAVGVLYFLNAQKARTAIMIII